MIVGDDEFDTGNTDTEGDCVYCGAEDGEPCAPDCVAWWNENSIDPFVGVVFDNDGMVTEGVPNA